MGVVDAFDLAIDTAIKDGTLDSDKHGATIEAARKVASMMDEPEWPIVRGKLDNVSPSVFLKYCDALGILPDADIQRRAKKPAQENNLIAFRNRSKVANG